MYPWVSIVLVTGSILHTRSVRDNPVYISSPPDDYQGCSTVCREDIALVHDRNSVATYEFEESNVPSDGGKISEWAGGRAPVTIVSLPANSQRLLQSFSPLWGYGTRLVSW